MLIEADLMRREGFLKLTATVWRLAEAMSQFARTVGYLALPHAVIVEPG